MIFPEALSPVKELRFLAIDNLKLRYPDQDLIFLKKVENTLTRLSMNGTFYKQNMESTSVLQIFKFEQLDDLGIRSNGLLNIKKIEEFAPNLTVLDLSGNKIFSVEAVEALHKLKSLAEINFSDNPICVHKHLKEMITDVVPEIEVINRETLKDAGHQYKQQLNALRKNLKNLGEKIVALGGEDDETYEKFEEDTVEGKA